MINLENIYLQELLTILKQTFNDSPCVSVYLFGSRTTNKIKPSSDIDLLVDFNQSFLPIELKAVLVAKLDESKIPYTVDIVDLNSISSEFYNHIKGGLVRIY